jgi:hypothetical protein
LEARWQNSKQMTLSLKTILAFTLIGIAALSACNYSGKQLSLEEKEHYMTLGETTINRVQGDLMANLVKALGEGGVEAAIPFCKLNADSLINSSARFTGVKSARRSTLKYRNKNNKATERDKNIFKVYDYAVKHGDSIKPILQLDPKHDQVLYYSPIFIQEACLKCHGHQNNGFTMANFNAVNKHYPKDKAFNYKLKELRGMWVIALEERPI